MNYLPREKIYIFYFLIAQLIPRPFLSSSHRYIWPNAEIIAKLIRRKPYLKAKKTLLESKKKPLKAKKTTELGFQGQNEEDEDSGDSKGITA